MEVMWKNICFVPNIREKAFQLLTFKYHLSCKYFVYALYHDEERTNLWLLLVGDREGRIESLGLANADCYMCSTMSSSWDPNGLYPTRLLCLWDFPGKNTGMCSTSFSRVFFQPRDWTHVSWIAGGLFTCWAI